jgi:hypothetical protein
MDQLIVDQPGSFCDSSQRGLGYSARCGSRRHTQSHSSLTIPRRGPEVHPGRTAVVELDESSYSRAVDCWLQTYGVSDDDRMLPSFETAKKLAEAVDKLGVPFVDKLLGPKLYGELTL